MNNPHDDEADHDPPGSPACFLRELDGDGRIGADRRPRLDVAHWRKAERQRLIALRLALAREYRAAVTRRIAETLDRTIPTGEGSIVSGYWPIQGEPDLRMWMRAAHERGIRIALPAALELGQPLVFHEWHPDAPMHRGRWNIPYPADGPRVVPSVVLAPLVGFDAAGFRLGYGGGFFDRTLASIKGSAVAIGIGFPESAIPTIYPQPHDIPMNRIVTGAEPPPSHGESASHP